MTTQAHVMSGLVTQLTPAITGLTVNGNPLTVRLAPGWPSFEDVSKVASSYNVEVGIYTRAESRDTTRWMPSVSKAVVTAATLTATIASSPTIPAHGSNTVTLGGTITLNDAIGLPFRIMNVWYGQTYVTVSTDTLTTAATGLAAAINANSSINSVLSATSTGAVVTIFNSSGTPVTFAAHTGNGQLNYIEAARYGLNLQLPIWAASPAIRDAVGDSIESALSKLKINFGYQSGDGDWVRIILEGQQLMDNDVLNNVFRRDFYLTIDYGVTFTDTLYSVLALIPSGTLNFQT